MTNTAAAAWVPDSCTLPTVEQPLRVAEFDDLFTVALRAVERTGPASARLILDESAAGRAHEFADRETSCCSFFEFSLEPAGPGRIVFLIRVPDSWSAVLEALVERAAGVAGLAG